MPQVETRKLAAIMFTDMVGAEVSPRIYAHCGCSEHKAGIRSAVTRSSDLII